jgi:hypothetical protein
MIKNKATLAMILAICLTWIVLPANVSTASNKQAKAQALQSSTIKQKGKPAMADNWKEVAEPLDACRLKETRNQFGGGAKGFPSRPWRSSIGKVKIAIIPIDFSNAVGAGSPKKMFRDDIRSMKRWATHFSRGKMNYEIEFNASKWIRAPKGAEWYTCTECQKGSVRDLQTPFQGAQEMISAADSLYNFKGVEIIYFVFPYYAEKNFGTATYGFNGRFATDEGAIEASFYGEMGGGVGAQSNRSVIWDHAVHEMLHFQGFVGHGPSNHTGHFITVNQWGPSKAVTSWEAFLNGWFAEEEILCLDKSKLSQSIFVTMSSIDKFGPHKESVMIRLNDDEIIVIERREPGPFTQIGTQGLKMGFTAYRVNVNGEHFRNDQDPTSDYKNFWSFLGPSTDPTIWDYVEYKDVKITPLKRKRVMISVVGD